ncbi:MAG: DoxX family membrane protein [Chitinivibrionales bacterium]|nr:DoxX family membrane protein [Chitinivibrionales bacterium]
MFLFHGWPKLTGGPEKWEMVGGAMQNLGINFAPVLWGFMAAISEFFGGLFLIAGLFTRIASAFMFTTMFVAASMHLGRGQGLGTASHAIELGIVFLSLIFIGAGKFSVDALLFKQWDTKSH